ncbi:MAG: winged helix-turn-helix transcriptional regulator [Candidatus Lokiarchaeota archaeon]|nr:winged helix-turn-helix transcriptional regulator [Candidatus Lokiarchaeota archaeon]
MAIDLNIQREKEIKATLSKCEDVSDVDSYFSQLSVLRKELKEEKFFDDFTEFFSALANKKRVMILNILKKKDRCVCEIEAVLDESQPAISHHLRILEKAGLIKGWKKGKFTHYDVVEEKLKLCVNLLINKLI